MLEYTDGFYSPINDDLHALRIEAEIAGVPIISRSVESFLRSLLRIKEPEIILEIGAAIGYSAAVFAHACANSIVISCERDLEMSKRARENISALKLEDRVRIIEGDYIDLDLKRSVAESGIDFERADFLFIDAAKGQYKKFWDKSMPFMREESIIVCDNILQRGATASDDFLLGRRFKTGAHRMREFLKYISDDKRVETVVLPLGDGISVSRVLKTGK